MARTLLPLLALLLTSCTTNDPAVDFEGEAVKADKVSVCHWSDDDEQYVLISVSSGSAHLDATKHPDDVLAGGWYPDGDGDGQGDAGGEESDCPDALDGWADNADDCDDDSADTYSGAPELCDGVDNDCDGSVPANELDADADGQAECEGDCDDADATSYVGATELCDDSADNDCDGEVDEDCSSVPEACDTGTDPYFGSPWVVCDADETTAWISADYIGQFHAEVICQDLGYDTVSSWSGTCGNVCGYCEGATSCSSPGRRNPEGRSWSTPNGGYTSLGGWIHRTVQWECVSY